MIKLQKLCRDFQVGEATVHALDNLDLEIADGEYVSIMGPSGSGKSTLLNLIGGLDRPSAGEVRIDGRALAGLGHTIMYAALAVVASAAGPRLSSLFVGVYLAAAGLTTSAASAMGFNAGLAWSLVLITLLLAAVVGCWHWEEHALPD